MTKGMRETTLILYKSTITKIGLGGHLDASRPIRLYALLGASIRCLRRLGFQSSAKLAPSESYIKPVF